MLQTTIGVDTEAQKSVDGKTWEPTWCIGIGDSESRTATTDIPRGLDAALAGGRTPVFQNAYYDIPKLEEATGKKYEGPWEDTLLLGHILGVKPLNLESMSRTFLGVDLDKSFLDKGVKKKDKRRFEEHPQEVLEGCSMDAYAADAMYHHFMRQMKPKWLEVYERDKKFSRVLMDMRARGLPVDQDKIKMAKAALIKKMGKLELTLMAHGISEPGNREFVGQKFWRHKKRVLYTDSGKLSTKGEDLKEHMTEEERPWVEAFLDWHRLSKLKSTYLDNWTGVDRVHPHANQTGTMTHRLSMSDPNLMNVAKSKDIPIFQMFVAPDGYVFISADYSQGELRRLAVQAQDQTMLNVYRRGGDLHQETVDGLVARGVIPEPKTELEKDAARRFAKTLNFGIPYGMGGKTYAKRTKLKTMITTTRWGKPLPRDRWYEGPDEAAGNKFIDGWYSRFTEVRPWQEEMIAFAEEYGYVETMEGRPLWVPGIYADRGYLYHHAQKQCGNYPIQGGLHEVMEDAMIRCNYGLVNEVHDEVLYLVPEREAQDYFDFLANDPNGLVDNRHEIPYTIDIHMGKTWGDIKNIDDIFLKSGDDEEDDE